MQSTRNPIPVREKEILTKYYPGQLTLTGFDESTDKFKSIVNDLNITLGEYNNQNK